MFGKGLEIIFCMLLSRASKGAISRSWRERVVSVEFEMVEEWSVYKQEEGKKGGQVWKAGRGDVVM